MAMESSVLVQPKRPDWHKHEQMQIHHTKSNNKGWFFRLSSFYYLLFRHTQMEVRKTCKQEAGTFLFSPLQTPLIISYR